MSNQIVPLSSLSVNGKGTYGIAASAVPYAKDKYTYLRITDINDDGTLNIDDLKSVDDPDACNYVLQPNDIVFARTGASTGRNYFYDGSDGTFVYAGFLIKFSIDPNKVNPLYVKYFCQSQKYRDWIYSFNTGSTRGNINERTLAQMPIELPSRRQQDLLVENLSKIDAKIKLNNQINRNLEEQAQAIFKSWFIDFEPFGGKMPEDWKKANIYSIANIIYGAPFSSKLFNTEKNGKPIYRIRDLREQHSDVYTPENIEDAYLIQPKDIVVGMDGEFRPYLWGGEPGWLNQRVCVFENNRPKGKAFLYFTLKPLLDKVEKTQVATTVIHIGKKDFDKFEILSPSNDVLDKFDELTSPIIDQIVSKRLENKHLANLRDSLLPRLMSSELNR